MKSKIYIAGLLTLAATACVDVNDDLEGYDAAVENLGVVKNNAYKYTLTDEDYATIAGFAKSGSEDYDTIAAIGTQKCFPSIAWAQQLIPQFIAQKWLYWDKGSDMTVTYNLGGSVSETLTALKATETYNLSDDDYATLGSEVSYLTPSTIGNLKSQLPSLLPEAEEGAYRLVSYKYSQNEPEAEPEITWTPLEIENWPSGSAFTYVNTGSIDLSAYVGSKIRIGYHYTSTTECAGTYEFKNLKVAEVLPENYIATELFAAQEDGSYAKVTSFDGEGKYIILANAADGYHSWGKLAEGKSYGYFVSDPITVTDGVIAAADAESIALTVAATSVYGQYTIANADGKYIYMKGTYNSYNIDATLPEDLTDGTYLWTLTFDGNNLVLTNVYSSKVAWYDSNHSSYGSYELNLSTYLDETLLSTSFPDGFYTNDILLPTGSTYVWKCQTKFGATASAYVNKVNCKSESWLVTSEIDLTEATAPALSFDWAANYLNGNDVKDFFEVAVTSDAASGSAASSTETKYFLYQYTEGAWTEASDILFVTPEDYTEMGLSNSNFSATYAPDAYVPKFINKNKPYAQEGEDVCVLYHYYANSETTLDAAEYILTDGIWTKPSEFETSSDHFVKSASGWIYDPSITIDLPYDKSNEFAKNFYQTVVDWVWENVDKAQYGASKQGEAFVTSYGNNEYYTGCSAFYNNVDWRPAKAREKFADGLLDADGNALSDDECLAFMQQNFIDVLGYVMPTLYPDAEPLADPSVELFYHITFVVWYDPAFGSNNAAHNFKVSFKVVGKGQFEYVEGSLVEED
ncbi:MAG: hypothetical protein PUD36_08085 [Bacteroidales bacterium]|nr:hypothetical protein [Bacteroidales bacterium]